MIRCSPLPQDTSPSISIEQYKPSSSLLESDTRLNSPAYVGMRAVGVLLVFWPLILLNAEPLTCGHASGDEERGKLKLVTVFLAYKNPVPALALCGHPHLGKSLTGPVELCFLMRE